jgi:hypothetical protein
MHLLKSTMTSVPPSGRVVLTPIEERAGLDASPALPKELPDLLDD